MVTDEMMDAIDMLIEICSNEEQVTEDKIRSNKVKQAKVLWEDFGEIPMTPETEEIEESWNGFPAGTHREEIWHWFEENFGVSVGEDLMGLL